MRLLSLALIVSAASLAPAASDAQTPTPAEAGPEIVITGTRDMEGEVRSFVGALTEATEGQLARFESAICPAAVGLSPRQALAVAARIRRVAEAAGMDVGKASCRPNVLLIVSADKRVFIEALLKRHPEYFGELSSRAVRRLARAPGPAAAWHLEGPKLDADGMELVEGSDGAAFNRTTNPASRITEVARPQFGAAAVVMEQKALNGLTVVQLGDYAAMRAFARSDPSKLPGTAPTILRALDTPMGEEVPLTLTTWDLAFLRSLTAAPNNLPAALQRSSIRRGVAKQLDKESRGD
jgi:hypothetical protein